MIAGLPVHWVLYHRQPVAPIVLSPHAHVYVRGFDGSEPQHPMRADHVHWANIVAYAVAHEAHDQSIHHNARQVRATTEQMLASDTYD